MFAVSSQILFVYCFFFKMFEFMFSLGSEVGNLIVGKTKDFFSFFFCL